MLRSFCTGMVLSSARVDDPLVDAVGSVVDGCVEGKDELVEFFGCVVVDVVGVRAHPVSNFFTRPNSLESIDKPQRALMATQFSK